VAKTSKKKASKRVQWRKGTWAQKNGAESVRLFKAGKTVREIAPRTLQQRLDAVAKEVARTLHFSMTFLRKKSRNVRTMNCASAWCKRPARPTDERNTTRSKENQHEAD
jgi:hypothetical protein